ncbi:hypothetical protein jhhlp_007360 [Lomentospora prolificans]|uniref:Uncharacterized protein n=1 Tax=Lomentospora prolificans TaxID=41688 RepID=A0A2N3N2F7_9PEZI|nr:hypothetical protein jhhlp_007360 [Lomentospora prolificans]
MEFIESISKPQPRTQGGFKFIHMSSPADAAAFKTQVRSHAARNPRARKKKVMRHQKEKRAEEVHGQELEVVPDTRSSKSQGPVYAHLDTSAVATGHVARILCAQPVDPFDSFCRPLNPMEHRLLDHFARNVIRYIVTCMPFQVPGDEARYLKGMTTYMIQTAAADSGMLSTLLLASCQSLSKFRHEDAFSTVALMYKGQCIASINDALRREAPVVSDLTLTKTLALAANAVRLLPALCPRHSHSTFRPCNG